MTDPHNALTELYVDHVDPQPQRWFTSLEPDHVLGRGLGEWELDHAPTRINLTDGAKLSLS